jgi:hypothetical protein
MASDSYHFSHMCVVIASDSYCLGTSKPVSLLIVTAPDNYRSEKMIITIMWNAVYIFK